MFGCGRDQHLVEETNTALGHPHQIFHMDVTNDEDVKLGMETLMQLTGGKGPDVLVNNAGYQELGPIEDLSIEIWKKQFDVNVFGYLRMIQAILPSMRKRNEGRIINVSSVAGQVVLPFYGAYCASKHAIEAISDALRMELKPFSVKVSIIEPGPMISNINFTGFANLQKNRPEGTAYDSYYKSGPFKLDHIEKISQPTELVSEAIWKAATSTRPRARYRVTLLSRLAILAKTFLPASISDRIIS